VSQFLPLLRAPRSISLLTDVNVGGRIACFVVFTCSCACAALVTNITAAANANSRVTGISFPPNESSEESCVTYS
jgi:hypothetical protein